MLVFPQYPTCLPSQVFNKHSQNGRKLGTRLSLWVPLHSCLSVTLLSLGHTPVSRDWPSSRLGLSVPTGTLSHRLCCDCADSSRGLQELQGLLRSPQCSMCFFWVQMGSCFSPLSSGVCGLCSIPSFISLIFTGILHSSHLRMSPSVALC